MGESAGRDCRPALASTHTHTYLGIRVCTCAGPVHTSGAMWHVCESVLNLCVAHMHQTRVCVQLGRVRICFESVCCTYASDSCVCSAGTCANLF